LPCSGKTTLAKRISNDLMFNRKAVYRLDGNDVRMWLSKDLGFSDEDRKENIRRVAEVAEIFNGKGLFVPASLITPTNDLRSMVKGIVRNLEMIYVRCPIEVCESRDVKGEYAKARRGEIKNFTGVSARFEEPMDCYVVDTENNDIDYCVRRILEDVVKL